MVTQLHGIASLPVQLRKEDLAHSLHAPARPALVAGEESLTERFEAVPPIHLVSAQFCVTAPSLSLQPSLLIMFT